MITRTGYTQKLVRALLLLVLVVAAWSLPATAQEATITPDSEGEPVIHTVTYGDSLYRIALRYGVTIDDLAAANDLSVWSWLQIGQQLVIPGLTVPDASEVVVNPLIAGTPTTHVVQPGDTLNNIAQKYGITIADLLKANNIANPDLIYRGQELTVWTVESVNSDTEPDPATLPELDATVPETTTGTGQMDLSGQPVVPPDYDVRVAPAIQATHVIQPGETLGRIAQKYGIGWQELAQANGILNVDTVYAGQTLIIPGLLSSASPEDLGTVLREQGPAYIIPQPEITSGKFILVDLSDSRVYAYQDGQFLFTALGSMGLPATPTVRGQYKIYQRYTAQTMSGPGYYLPNVEYVQYFYQGYALHGAYWHSNWGQPMSHGCVNLRNEDAQWLYQFGEIGTPVHVQV